MPAGVRASERSFSVFLRLAVSNFKCPGASKFRQGPQRLGDELCTFCFSLLSPQFLEVGEGVQFSTISQRRLREADHPPTATQWRVTGTEQLSLLDALRSPK